MSRRAAAIVSVRAQAVLGAEPDFGILAIALSALDPSPWGAMTSVVTARAGARGRARRAGHPAADRSTSQVTLSEDVDHTIKGRRLLAHRATTTVFARLDDPELIGRLISRASDDPDVGIYGPCWQIAPENPVHLRAALRAAASAREKAAAYAIGIGVELGRVIRLSEPGAEAAGGPMMKAAFSADLASAMPVDPGERDDIAVVEATFELASTSSRSTNRLIGVGLPARAMLGTVGVHL